MNLFALGLNHNTAPLALREKVAFSSEELDTANQKIRAMLGNSAGGGIKEVAILSTELYESATMTNVYVLDCTLQIPQK